MSEILFWVYRCEHIRGRLWVSGRPIRGNVTRETVFKSAKSAEGDTHHALFIVKNIQVNRLDFHVVETGVAGEIELDGDRKDLLVEDNILVG